MQGGTMAIKWICRPRLFECVNCTGTVAELLAQLAERKPGRGIAGRKLEHLRQQFGGARKIALGLAVARPLETPVGNHVARGQKDLADHSYSLPLCAEYISKHDASRRYPGSHAVGRLLQAGRLSYRSDSASRESPDHTWAFRPRTRRPPCRARYKGNAGRHAPALRREFRRHHPGDPIWRGIKSRQRAREFSSGRPRTGLRADPR